MFENLFIQGWIIGLFIAMPVGPIGMLCIQHSLTRGMTYGLAAGLGATLADTLYGGVAVFGMTLVSHLLAHHHLWFQLVGAIFLCSLGIFTLKSKPAEKCQKNTPKSLTRVCLVTFFLTLTNPLTFLGFASLYTGLGIELEQGVFSNLLLMTGVFMGSACWWFLLSCGASKLSKKMSNQFTLVIHKISGSVILTCGFITTLTVFQQFIF